MRIAILAPPWLPVPPGAYGGTESVLNELCRALVDAGHDVMLYATGDSTCPVERAWTHQTAVGTDLFSPIAELRQIVDGYRAIDEWGADVVHDNTVAGPLVEHGPGPTIVTTNHGPYTGDAVAVYRAIGERVPIIAISHHQGATAVAAGIPIGAVIHHGIDPRRFPMGDGTGGYVAFLGRMSPEKGVDTAIRVARAAGMPLKIAAKMHEPGEYSYFRDVVQPLLGSDTEYVGEIGPEDKLDFLGGALCLLNPIVFAEPFGMVMIEAMACGTPVVASPSGAAPEIVDDGETGFVCVDEDSLRKALDTVIHLDRAACRRAVEQRFSATRMAADHVALYERLRQS